MTTNHFYYIIAPLIANVNIKIKKRHPNIFECFLQWRLTYCVENQKSKINYHITIITPTFFFVNNKKGNAPQYSDTLPITEK